MGTDDWNLCPRELIQNFDIEIHYASGVKAVDLSYPIYIYHHMDQWIILDGVHRFTKAMMQGDKTMKVKKVNDEHLRKAGII